MKQILQIFILSIIVIACSVKQEEVSSRHIVNVRLIQDPDQLNPINSRNESAKIIVDNIFQTLVNTNRRSYELVPVLAKSRPQLSIDSSGRMIMDFEIKEEAVWPNGSKVTAKDVLFSVKVVKNPLTNCFARKPYLEFVSDIIIDEENDKKFTVISNKPYHLGESAMDALYILPEYFYDGEGLMKEISLLELESESAVNDTNIIRFAEQFNSEVFQRKKICGSGAYEFVAWETNQSLTIRKKQNWWGDQFLEENMYFEAHPEELHFKIIPDMHTAIAALKQKEIDVMRRIGLREFTQEFPEDPIIKENYQLLSPAKFSYDYIGFNTQHEILKDPALRRALSGIVNIDQVVEKLCFGLAEKTVGFVHPAKKEMYNHEIVPYSFNLEKVNDDLSQLGWVLNNESGIREQVINGEVKKLSFKHMFPASSDMRKKHAIVLKEYAKKVGVELNLLPVEASIFVQRLVDKDFDMYQSGWIAGPGEHDPKQIWHTESIKGGSNYVSYGSAYSDSLIDLLRVTMEAEKRNVIYKELQVDIHKEAPYIFMMCVNERIAISTKFSNVFGTAVRPGFWAASLRKNWLKK